MDYLWTILNVTFPAGSEGINLIATTDHGSHIEQNAASAGYVV
jgi:hypothetical protein